MICRLIVEIVLINICLKIKILSHFLLRQIKKMFHFRRKISHFNNNKKKTKTLHYIVS